MFRGLLWLFNFLHKEWRESSREKGVMQFSIFAQFLLLKRHGDTLGFVVMRLSLLWVPTVNDKPVRMWVNLQVSVWPLWTHIAAARWGITPFFAILRGISLQAFRSRPQPPNSHETTHHMADVVEHGVCEWSNLLKRLCSVALQGLMYEAIPRSNHFLSASNTGEFLEKGLWIKTVEARLRLDCSLVRIYLFSCMEKRRTFNLAKCEWLSLSLD